MQERLVHEQLLKFFVDNSLLPDEQYGFLRGRSTEWQLVSLLEDWHAALDRRQHVHAAFLDAAKAFDSVDHTILHTSFVTVEFVALPLVGFKAICQDDVSAQESEAVFRLSRPSPLEYHRARFWDRCSSYSFIRIYLSLRMQLRPSLLTTRWHIVQTAMGSLHVMSLAVASLWIYHNWQTGHTQLR